MIIVIIIIVIIIIIALVGVVVIVVVVVIINKYHGKHGIPITADITLQGRILKIDNIIYIVWMTKVEIKPI